jgi:hypothetical protein
MDALLEFRERLDDDWLPAFCDPRPPEIVVNGFVEKSIDKLSAFDARWFMTAVDAQLVSHVDGFFATPQNHAKELIFWTGTKQDGRRRITLWIEPIITIGAVARLVHEFGWPADRVGTQSKTWAFDLVCYGTDLRKEPILGEVKKSEAELSALVRFMRRYGGTEPLATEPKNARELNAYRKVKAVRGSWPRYVWALGPKDCGSVFAIRREGSSLRFAMDPIDRNALTYRGDTYSGPPR